MKQGQHVAGELSTSLCLSFVPWLTFFSHVFVFVFILTLQLASLTKVSPNTSSLMNNSLAFSPTSKKLWRNPSSPLGKVLESKVNLFLFSLSLFHNNELTLFLVRLRIGSIRRFCREMDQEDHHRYEEINKRMGFEGSGVCVVYGEGLVFFSPSSLLYSTLTCD